MKTNKVAEYWNKRGATYDRSWQSVAKKRLSGMETDYFRRAYNSINNGAKRKLKVLDIGIAIGRISDVILEYNVEFYGTDISKTMVDFCKEKYKKNKKVKDIRIHDIHQPLPKSWGKFDIVTAYRVLAYTRQLPKELENIRSAMNPGGILVFTCPNKNSSAIIPIMLYSKGRLGYEMSYGELKKIVESAGFSEYHIGGFSRLLDTFYDKCNSELSANILFGAEKFLSLILGDKLFVRLFYVTCKK